ncbi:uncharacterized protein ARMOST_14772 [Armillaria ostoyae]|uniref:Uncharacterized protein n=1 Tax=Armillaria ostoyae TaxID=47428 RepID=A0A284RRH1_ARMOS|nr:uncharacterized protein ARMOST_14772 [Armillaria ostoyae]
MTVASSRSHHVVFHPKKKWRQRPTLDSFSQDIIVFYMDLDIESDPWRTRGFLNDRLHVNTELRFLVLSLRRIGLLGYMILPGLTFYG